MLDFIGACVNEAADMVDGVGVGKAFVRLALLPAAAVRVLVADQRDEQRIKALGVENSVAWAFDSHLGEQERAQAIESTYRRFGEKAVNAELGLADAADDVEWQQIPAWKAEGNLWANHS